MSTLKNGFLKLFLLFSLNTIYFNFSNYTAKPGKNIPVEILNFEDFHLKSASV